MDNFYNSNDNFPPQTPPYYEQPQRYQGSSSCASASLILGILSLLSICCMPPLALVFAGLALILGALSKGDRTRPQNARVGMILSGISLIAVLILLAVFLVRFTSNSTNIEFFKQYLNFLLAEVPLEQTLERLAVAGFVARHLMHGVVDRVEVMCICSACGCPYTLTFCCQLRGIIRDIILIRHARHPPNDIIAT